MAATNRAQSRSGNRRRRSSRSSNSGGRNRPGGITNNSVRSGLATAAVVGGAIATGVFLWSRRNQLGEHIDSLTDRIGDWRQRMSTGDNFTESDDAGHGLAGSSPSENGSGRTQEEIAQEALTLKQLGETAELPA